MKHQWSYPCSPCNWQVSHLAARFCFLVVISGKYSQLFREFQLLSSLTPASTVIFPKINAHAEYENERKWAESFPDGFWSLADISPSIPGVIEIPVTCAVSFNREEVYGDMFGTEDVSDRVILSPTNNNCLQKYWKCFLEKPQNTSVQTQWNVTTKRRDPIEFLNSLIPSGMPPHPLKL